MTHLADLAALGDIPAQHFGSIQSGYEPTRLNLVRKIRYLGISKNTFHNQYDPQTFGYSSVDGCWLPADTADPDGVIRQTALWAHAVPATTQTPAEGTQEASPYAATTKVTGTTLAIPAFTQGQNGNFWVDDTGIIPQPVAPPQADLPGGVPGIALPLTVWSRQDTAFVPSGNFLIDPWAGGKSTDKYGTLVWDVTAKGDLDPNRTARIQTAWRTYRLPQSGKVTFGATQLDPSGLAWQLGLDIGGQAGWGMVAEAPDMYGGGGPAPLTPQQKALAANDADLARNQNQINAANASGADASAARAALQDERNNLIRARAEILAGGSSAGTTSSPSPPGGTTDKPTSTTSVGSKQAIAAMGRDAGGPIGAGGASCPHVLGANDDGETIYSGHHDEKTLIRGQTGDAPFSFDATPWIPPTQQGPFIFEVWCRVDLNSKHTGPWGTKDGLRRWETTGYFDQPPGTGGNSTPENEQTSTAETENTATQPNGYAEAGIGGGEGGRQTTGQADEISLTVGPEGTAQTVGSEGTSQTVGDEGTGGTTQPGIWPDVFGGGGGGNNETLPGVVASAEASFSNNNSKNQRFTKDALIQVNITPPPDMLRAVGPNFAKSDPLPPEPPQVNITNNSNPSTNATIPGGSDAADEAFAEIKGDSNTGPNFFTLGVGEHISAPPLTLGDESSLPSSRGAFTTGGNESNRTTDRAELLASPGGAAAAISRQDALLLPFGFNFLESPGVAGNPLQVPGNSKINNPRTYARTPLALASSTILALPSDVTKGAVDLGAIGSHMSDAAEAQYDATPVAGQIAAFGSQQRKLKGQASRWLGGSAYAGGFATLPSNVSQVEWQRGEPLPASMPDTYSVSGTFASQNALADVTLGGEPKDGYVSGRGSFTTASSDWADSNGKIGGNAGLPSATFSDSGQSAIDPPPAYQIWGGQVVTVNNTTNGQAAAGTVFVADGTNTAPGGTWQTVSGIITPGAYGDGVDGSAAFDGVNPVAGATGPVGTTYTLARDVFYTTITVSQDVVISTNGFRVFAKTSCVFSTPAGGHVAGKFSCDGGAASTIIPGAGAPSNINATLGSGNTGGANNGTGTAGNTTGLVGIGGSGGNGGAGTNVGGNAGASVLQVGLGDVRSQPQIVLGAFIGVANGLYIFGVQGGVGGASGGGTTPTNSGGGGGGGGGIGAIACPTFTLVAAATHFSAKGGAGGTDNASGVKNGGGGGGGGGGWLFTTASPATLSSYTDVTGGAHGLGQNGGANGVAGSNGQTRQLPP